MGMGYDFDLELIYEGQEDSLSFWAMLKCMKFKKWVFEIEKLVPTKVTRPITWYSAARV